MREIYAAVESDLAESSRRGILEVEELSSWGSSHVPPFRARLRERNTEFRDFISNLDHFCALTV
jgi:hypothetical protein